MTQLKQYKLIPFLLHTTKEITIIQNEKTTCILTDKNLIDFFKINDKNFNLSFTIADLNKKYAEKAEFCLNFLLNNSLAVEENFYESKIKQIYFFTNSDIIKSSLEYNLEGVKKISYKTFLFDLNNITEELFLNLNNKEAVYYFILNPFNYAQYTKLANILREINLIHKFVFYYNYSFYFTNYYKAEWYNPCPLCYFSQLEGSLRSYSKLNNNISFQTIVDLIYTKTTYFETECILNNFKSVKLINVIIEDITSLDDYTIKLVKQLNMKDFKIDYDIAIPWEVCVCHE